ncbi:alpha/beta fold hydrolase [Paraglaciecola aestuariivivens]
MYKLFNLGLVALIFSQTLRAEPIRFPNIANNVPYSAVTALPFAKPQSQLEYGQSDQQFAQFWPASEQNQSDFPYVIFIHGGCWLSAYNIEHSYALTTGLAQAGFNVWSIEYRRTGQTAGGWPKTFDDVLLAIRSIAGQDPTKFDLSNAVLVGHSAGGHLALLAASQLPQIKAVIGLAAITDIAKYSLGSNSCQKVTKDFMGATLADNPAIYELANPVKQKVHAYSYLLRGEKDIIVPDSELPSAQHTNIIVAGAGHFDWLHPGSDSFKSLVKQLTQIAEL